MEENIEKNLCKIYNLMKVSFDKIENIEKDKVDKDIHVGVLLGMPVVLYKIGKNTKENQEIVSELSKYNHPSLALYYGYTIESIEEIETTYLIRELVSGKNFHSINKYHLHDKLIILYKICCLIEYMHSFNISFNILHPTKIIITDDIEIKLIDHINNEQSKTKQFQLSIEEKYNDDELRFIHPNLLFNINDNEKYNIFLYDSYSFGCLMIYGIYDIFPFDEYENISQIINLSNEERVSVHKKLINNRKNTNTDRFLTPILNLMKGISNNSNTPPIEEMRLFLEKQNEVQEYKRDGTYKFDFDEESKKVIESISNIINEIDSLYKENDIPEELNTLNYNRIKYYNFEEIDFNRGYKKNKN